VLNPPTRSNRGDPQEPCISRPSRRGTKYPLRVTGWGVTVRDGFRDGLTGTNCCDRDGRDGFVDEPVRVGCVMASRLVGYQDPAVRGALSADREGVRSRLLGQETTDEEPNVGPSAWPVTRLATRLRYLGVLLCLRKVVRPTLDPHPVPDPPHDVAVRVQNL
jgi:hypothetical protein